MFSERFGLNKTKQTNKSDVSTHLWSLHKGCRAGFMPRRVLSSLWLFYHFLFIWYYYFSSSIWRNPRWKSPKEQRVYCGSQFQGTVHHIREGMAAGAQGNWSLCLQSGSREMNAGTLLAFSFLFSPEPQLIHGAIGMQYGPSHLIQPNPEMLLLDDSRSC